ncbi:YchJ family metal-binding protein [Ramlibacter sp. AN1015]|uniref:YchJ family protein n=1 Tax=Ramlibacter sp. AN1015 TaxID=3133428 RepID=UPI0030C2A315
MAFARCCGPCLHGEVVAADAEALMRSRYSAFVRGDADYLLSTWHPRTRPAQLTLEPAVKWLGLDVRAHYSGPAGRAEVEFVARSRGAGGRAVRLHERSRFEQDASGRWLYVDGDML